MKQNFINKWSKFWILHPESNRLNKAFIRELEALIEHEKQQQQQPQDKQ
jgi:hypothetical protein